MPRTQTLRISIGSAAIVLAVAVIAMGWVLSNRLTQVIGRPHGEPAARMALPSVVAPPGAPSVAEVQYEPVAPETALSLNAAVPLQTVGPAARPFILDQQSPAWPRAVECLTQAIYYEAANEPTDGKRGVAQVVLNRVRSPAFPNSVCGVVFQGSERPTGCQFTFTCDGSLARQPAISRWAESRKIAIEALRGYVFRPVGHATHYHASYVVPYWSSSMAKVAVIGLHNFYRWPGTWRPSSYFSPRYANAEPGALNVLAQPAPVFAGPLVPLSSNLVAVQAQAGKDRPGKAKPLTRTLLAEDQHNFTLKDDVKRPQLNEHLLQSAKPLADMQSGSLKDHPTACKAKCSSAGPSTD